MNGNSTHPLKQGLNVFLRLISLAAKLILTLYMGRYLGLADMGVYGLVFGAVVILSDALAFRFDYIVGRDLVGVSPAEMFIKMRDQTFFMLLNHMVLGVVILTVYLTDITSIAGRILFYIFALSITENFATAAYVNTTSQGRPVFANILFFVRSASWVFPVVILGMWNEAFRNVDVILMWWLIGVTLSLLLALWSWRNLPWTEGLRRPIQWTWLKRGVQKSFLIWLGAIGISMGAYNDRFFVERFIGLDEVGILTFYASFALALMTMVYSGVLAFVYPRLIKWHREKNKDAFWREAKQAGWQTAAFATFLAIGLGIAVPIIGLMMNKPELVAEKVTFWLMLVGVWIRSNADTLYQILFARHQDKSIWLGNLLFLIPAVGGSIIFIPAYGFIGVGYSAIAAALFLLIWRAWCVYRGGGEEPV